MTAGGARSQATAIRELLSRALRCVSVPEPDWGGAAVALLCVSVDARDLALACLDEKIRGELHREACGEPANGLPAGLGRGECARARSPQLTGADAPVLDESDSHKE